MALPFPRPFSLVLLQLVEDMSELGLVEVGPGDFDGAAVGRVRRMRSVGLDLGLGLYGFGVVHAAVDAALAVDQLADLLHRDVQRSDVLLLGLHRVRVDFVNALQKFDFVFFQLLEVAAFFLFLVGDLLGGHLVGAVQLRQTVLPVLPVFLLGVLGEVFDALLLLFLLLVDFALDLLDLALVLDGEVLELPGLVELDEVACLEDGVHLPFVLDLHLLVAVPEQLDLLQVLARVPLFLD